MNPISHQANLFAIFSFLWVSPDNPIVVTMLLIVYGIITPLIDHIQGVLIK